MRNAYWVEPGRLLAGPYPRPETLPALAAVGITAYIDLTQAGELDEYDHLIGSAVHHRRAVGDFGVPTDAELTATLDLIDELLDDGHCIYVHCWAGVGRTGTVVACHLIRQGMPNAEALAQIATLRAAIGRHDPSPEMPAQRALVERWR
jgi:protein-tyrosine phosphatase